ncbi:hypothetical protein AWE51_22325 [Aquimarina aggregata]|uniref:Transferase n=2 Tax=Aquimarina aggregata TaxID=1642818 RepID=A0A163BIS3_9FLAO|nr:hypothetical protein AWE51_22325 [Aquimarina aggregata]
MANLCLKLLGHQIAWSAKIGFVFLCVDKLILGPKVTIGHFNFIYIKNLTIEDEGYIGKLNVIKGPLSCVFKKRGAIGNLNFIKRSAIGITYGEARLELGELTKLTTRHYIDVTRDIIFGDFSILAGSGSQMWTHGYVHGQSGAERIRVDGEIKVGNNVYIGSRCIFNPGVLIGDGVTVGGNSAVTKNLIEKGMYMSQRLRHVEKDINEVRNRLIKVTDFDTLDDVYEK